MVLIGPALDSLTSNKKKKTQKWLFVRGCVIKFRRRPHSPRILLQRQMAAQKADEKMKSADGRVNEL